MANKYSYEEVKQDFEKRGYMLLTSKEEYKNVNQKLRYICPKHGEKLITYAHLREGKGCSECGRERTVKAETKPEPYYKEKAEAKGFKFIGTHMKNGERYVDIICPKHMDKGVQHVQAQNLNRNKGCKYCAGNAKVSDDEKQKRFVEKMQNVFNGMVSVVGKYENQNIKIDCFCNIHNKPFSSFPSNLTRGHTGCPNCKSEKLRKVNLKDSEQFEKEVKMMNPHILLLDKYTGVGQNLRCFCTIHKKEFTKYFSRLIHDHTGCDECYKEDIRNRMGKTTEDFSKELYDVHPELEIRSKYINRKYPNAISLQ